MNIAILGGSFDPPHLGHILIAQQVKELLNMDQIWLMPLYQKEQQDKIFHKTLSPVADRLLMAKYLENDFIKISKYEIEHNQTSYTVDTLEQLETLSSNDEFYWITGSDQLAEFQKYYKWEELVHKHKLIIFPREHMLWHLEDKVKEGFNLQIIPKNVIVLDNKDLVLTNISSRIVRERVKKGLSITHLVPKAVEEYIKGQKLYQ
ncbi:MAG TPA: nicotinate (nicotinamide) nucleotide adenylyltransferase [Methylomirabilota bacterium]|nr:nicotinate (nicotinamide) nucleotide adenylyltransferase [Methylomirabilota bacterium]